MNRGKRVLRQWLTLGLTPHWCRVHAQLLDEFMRAWGQWIKIRKTQGDTPLRHEGETGESLVVWLLRYLDQCTTEINRLHTLQVRFIHEHDRASDQQEQWRIILDYARELGSTGLRLWGDRRALRRWFDREAVIDRCIRRRAQQEQRLSFALDRLGVASARLIQEALEGGQEPGLIWARVAIERPLLDMLTHEGDHRVVLAAFRALTTALQALPVGEPERLIEEPTLRYIYRSSLESRQHVWIQSEALELLEYLSPNALEMALKQRLTSPREGDDLFVRRRAVALLLRHEAEHTTLHPLLEQVMSDPSPFVRQGLAEGLGWSRHLGGIQLLTQLATADAEPSVRMAALLALAQQMELHSDAPTPLLDALLPQLEHEPHPLVLRTLIHATLLVSQTMAAHPNERLEANLERCRLALGQCACLTPELPVRRWAAQAAEKVRLWQHPIAYQVAQQLQQLVLKTPAGRSRRIPRRLAQRVTPETLGRILAVLAQDELHLTIRQGWFSYRLYRGDQFGFRWWRFIHEMRHPSTDKRQAFSHLIGRHFQGQIHAPSTILNEMSPTKVPGEPLYMDAEGGWRPYLPLVDEMISILEQGGQVDLHTAQGITHITPPRWPWGRLRALWHITVHFPRYATLRNFKQEQGGDMDEYIRTLTQLGFAVRFSPRYDDPSVQRFFSAAGVIPFIDPELQRRFEEYFFSAYENSIYELIIFASLALGLFLARHLWLGLQIRRERRHIPLVIGGWGTRGKSGTERLKAAVFHAHGLGVISKTTGCEAMFIHAPPFMAAREMFLFRPYDKATIWEQHNLVTLSQKLDCQVFLWECMALTPSYVRLLQHDWMRDDLSTITNAYPDHEDLQGPAGINIPAVIAQFIPEHAQVISSEEQMAPILREVARSVNTPMDEVGWLDAGLLTPDILARFPYAEHPNNIALVTRLCTRLGLPADESLKAMADQVIPDIGVLKIYPAASLNGRWLSFVNGMSANERLGCLSNWRRVGFAQHNPEQQPNEWLATVVNNRADRVARTKVFARLLVQDISADLHLLIGGNLSGLMGFIEEELAAQLAGMSLWPAADDHNPQQQLLKQAHWLRIPTSAAAVTGRIRSMLIGMGVEQAPAATLASQWEQRDTMTQQITDLSLEHGAQLLTWIEHFRSQYQAWKILDQRVSATPTIDEGLDTLYRQWVHSVFMGRIVVVWDYHASGNDIIRALVQQTPPGLHNRTMGIQNIKGTGLDFVYRWQAWDQCQRGCYDLISGQPARFSQGLSALTSFGDYGPLCEQLVRQTLISAKSLPEAQTEKVQADLQLILVNMEHALAKDQTLSQTEAAQGGRFDWLFEAVEAFLDAGDAVKRRKQANRIYKELMHERISRQRAADLLGELIKRQSNYSGRFIEEST